MVESHSPFFQSTVSQPFARKVIAFFFSTFQEELMLKAKRPISLLFILLALTTVSVLAQTSTSSITGRVVDSKEAILPGATVTVTNEATGLSQTQTTTESGVYAFASLPVGTYTVTVEQTGFKKFQQTHNALEVGTPLAVDVVLEVGQVSEVV